MLEHLYGPSPRLLPDSTEALELTGTFWDDTIGLCGWHRGSGAFPLYMITQFDGLTHIRGGTQAGMTNWASFAIEQNSSNVYTFGNFDGTVYHFDKQVGNITDVFIDGGGIAQFSDCDYLCPDRWLTAFRFNDGSLRVSFKPVDGSADFVVESFITDIVGPSGKACWSHTGDPNLAYIVTTSGVAIKYNVTTKTFLPESIAYLPANRKAWYSPRFDVFVLLFDDNTVGVYASAPRPYSLSNPVAVPNLTRAQIGTVQVQLLGQNGEPCPDELIDWALTAGDGELLTLQSTTDANGYAQAQYLAPMTGGTNPTIQAQMRF